MAEVVVATGAESGIEEGAKIGGGKRTSGPAGLPRLEAIAPRDASRALEARRFSDPGVFEGATPVPLVAYRGAGCLAATLGVGDPSQIRPGPHRIPGYLVCVHGRSYIRPLLLASACEQHSTAVVLELHIPVGTPALWIPGSGDPATVNGADLICLDNVSIEFTTHRLDHNTPILEFEVSPD